VPLFEWNAVSTNLTANAAWELALKEKLGLFYRRRQGPKLLLQAGRVCAKVWPL